MTAADPNVRFCWTLRREDAARIRQSLDDAHPRRLEARAAPPAPGADLDLEDLLRSVGLHLDEEPAGDTGMQTMLEGVTAASALTGALDDLAHSAPTGFVLDTRFDSVQIEEHRSIGRGTIVLVDGEGARLLGSREGRAAERALRAAAAAHEA